MLLALLLPLGLPCAQEPMEDLGLADFYGERYTTEARVYRSAGHSVVSVDVYSKLFSTKLPNPTDLLGQLGPPISQGTGVVIDPKGFVITNAHVVQADERLASDQYLITLSFGADFGGKKVVARVLNIDTEWDLALLKIDEGGSYRAIPLAEPDDLLIGEKVIAIGTAYGNTHSVTSGILSGVQRDVNVMSPAVGNGRRSTHKLTGLLQTDAAINPGNSGGPLLNAKGDLIGINSATLDFADGIGYAIPVGRVTDILSTRLLQPRVWMGMNMSSEGALTVGSVHPRGPAAQAGLEAGDRVVGINGISILDPKELFQELVLMEAGEVVAVDYERGDRRRIAELTLHSISQRDSFGVLGFLVDQKPVMMVIQDSSGWPTRYPVLKLAGVFEGTGASRLGLKANDLLIAVHLLDQPEGDGWVPVTSEKQLMTLVRSEDFDFHGLNVWWMDQEKKSHKGRLTFDDPEILKTTRES